MRIFGENTDSGFSELKLNGSNEQNVLALVVVKVSSLERFKCPKNFTYNYAKTYSFCTKNEGFLIEFKTASN